MELDLRADLIVVSDIHLGRSDDARGRLLSQILQAAVTQGPDVFVLLGDIFDFCHGGSRFFQKKFACLGKQLERLAQSGTRVIFFEGNHEFAMRDIGWKGVELVSEGDKIIKLKDGTRVKLAHGDLVYASPSYRRFRNLVKSRFADWSARNILPSRLLDFYALNHAKASRASDHFRGLDHQGLVETMHAWAAGCELGIFGHFHVPYAEPRADGSGSIYGLHSWDQPNYLKLCGTKASRFYYEAPAQKWVERPIQAIILQS